MLYGRYEIPVPAHQDRYIIVILESVSDELAGQRHIHLLLLLPVLVICLPGYDPEPEIPQLIVKTAKPVLYPERHPSIEHVSPYQIPSPGQIHGHSIEIEVQAHRAYCFDAADDVLQIDEYHDPIITVLRKKRHLDSNYEGDD